MTGIEHWCYMQISSQLHAPSVLPGQNILLY